MRIAIALFLFVFPRVATIADAAELFYPGTFDPFHNTHYQEVLGELKKDPSLKVTILPVEDAFYNRQAGLPRPLFFPYDDKVAILRDSFSGYPHVQVSERLRKIDRGALKTILGVVESSSDPDKRILIGTDILDIWKDLPGFRELISRVKLVVDDDPKNPDLTVRLVKQFADIPNVTFVHNEVDGIRSSLPKKLLLSGRTDEAFAMLPPGYQNRYSDPKALAALAENYDARQTEWDQQVFRKKLAAVLRDAGVDGDVVKGIAKNPGLAKAFLELDITDEASLQRFVGRVDATLPGGVPKSDTLVRQLKKAFAAKEFRESFPDAHMQYVKYLFADYHPKVDLPPSKIKPPEYLFHWTNQWKLDRMDAYNADKTKVPLRFVRDGHLVTQTHPELAGKEGLFAWSNPVTGMAADTSEVYARPDSGNPPRLLVMKPKASASVIEIETYLDDTTPRVVPNLEYYDLILNRAYKKDGTLEYSEWIVRNPDAIESYSADPKVAAPLLRRELEKLQTPGFEYREEELMSPGFRKKDFWLKRTKDFLRRNSSRNIPAALRQSLVGGSIPCPAAFGAIPAAVP